MQQEEGKKKLGAWSLEAWSQQEDSLIFRMLEVSAQSEEEAWSLNYPNEPNLD